jgi:hypothetical protein
VRLRFAVGHARSGQGQACIAAVSDHGQLPQCTSYHWQEGGIDGICKRLQYSMHEGIVVSLAEEPLASHLSSPLPAELVSPDVRRIMEEADIDGVSDFGHQALGTLITHTDTRVEKGMCISLRGCQLARSLLYLT